MAQPFCSQGRLGLLWKWCKNGRYNHELFQQSAKVYEASPTSQTYVAEWTVSGARKTCHFSLCSIYVPIIIWFSLHGIWHHDSWSMINIYIFCTSFQSRRSRQNNSLSLSLLRLTARAVRQGHSDSENSTVFYSSSDLSAADCDFCTHRIHLCLVHMLSLKTSFTLSNATENHPEIASSPIPVPAGKLVLLEPTIISRGRPAAGS